MASLNAEKPVANRLSGQVKGLVAKATEGASKAPASKSALKKAAPKPQEPKKKGKGGKAKQ